MRWTRLALLFCAVAALATAPRAVHAQTVDLSLNVFPTNLAVPNNGGTWNIVAKTSGGTTNLGIAAISVFLRDVNVAGLMVEPDINSILNGGVPFNGVFAGSVNIVYGQDTSMAPIVAGVGTPSFSDGPDPLGSAFWNGATKIFKGTYSTVVPSFSAAAGQQSGANVLASTTPGTPAISATVTNVVRVQVPEPATAVMATMSLLGAIGLRRRQLQRSAR